MNDDIRFIKSLSGGPYPVCDHTQLSMFMAGVKTYSLDEAIKFFKQSRAKLMKLWEGGIASRAASDAEAASIDWFDALKDRRVANRLTHYERGLGSVSRVDFLVAVLDDWNENDADNKSRSILEAMRYKAEIDRSYDPAVGPVAKLHFRYVKGVPIPLPIDHDGVVDNVDVFDVRGLSTLVGWSRAVLVMLHELAFPKGGE